MPVEKKKFAQRGKAFCSVLWVREMIFPNVPGLNPTPELFPGTAQN